MQVNGRPELSSTATIKRIEAGGYTRKWKERGGSKATIEVKQMLYKKTGKIEGGSTATI